MHGLKKNKQIKKIEHRAEKSLLVTQLDKLKR